MHIPTEFLAFMHSLRNVFLPLSALMFALAGALATLPGAATAVVPAAEPAKLVTSVSSGSLCAPDSVADVEVSVVVTDSGNLVPVGAFDFVVSYPPDRLTLTQVLQGSTEITATLTDLESTDTLRHTRVTGTTKGANFGAGTLLSLRFATAPAAGSPGPGGAPITVSLAPVDATTPVLRGSPVRHLNLQASRDATLFLSETGAFADGKGADLYLGATLAGDSRRTLVQFDLAGQLPAGTTIAAATLEIAVNKARPSVATFSLHRVTRAWAEGPSAGTGGQGVESTDGDVTWIHSSKPGSLWTTPGGDYATTQSATLDYAGLAPYSITGPQLVDDVRDWLSGAVENHGWLLRAANEEIGGTAIRLDSREATTGQRPNLSITYNVDEVPFEVTLDFAATTGLCPPPTPSPSPTPSPTASETPTPSPSPTADPDADADNDGFTDSFESANGSDPNNPADRPVSVVDFNGDGKLTSLDAVVLYRAMRQGQTIIGPDLTGDSQFDIDDAIALYRFSIGAIAKLPLAP